MLKILSFQPGSLYTNGGAARVLRRLYQGRENSVVSLVITENSGKTLRGSIREYTVAAFPLQRNWYRWNFRHFIINLRHNKFKACTEARARKVAEKLPFDVLHIVNHGPFTTALCEGNLLNGKQVWVSFHDHFSTTNTSFESTKKLWGLAHRRLLISEELGREYQRLFGDKGFEIITDGLNCHEISSPESIDTKAEIIIYFAGLLHIEYYPLFEALASALDALSKQGSSIKLILRGTQELNFLYKRGFVTEYRSGFISDEDIKKEMDTADILYLPIKFTIPEFYLYSLSTKMVSYTGAPGTILYHGPADSAACKMLKAFGAAVFCHNLIADDLVIAINALINEGESISHNAKILANEKFNLAEIQNKFWGGLR